MPTQAAARKALKMLAEVMVKPPATRPPSRQGKVIIAAYFDEGAQQFAILSVKQRCTQAALLAEALNLVFERYGEPPIAKA